MSIYPAKNYQKTLRQVQAELSPWQRAASKLLHKRLVWHVSELCESVLLRFIPTTLGYCLAIVGGLALVAIAFIFNYALLSLHILFLLFIVGYMIGVIVDYIRLLSRR